MAKPQVELDFPVAFKELFNKKWRYIVYYGGRSSGKSHSTAIALLIRGRMEKLRVLATREVQNTIKDSVIKLLSDYIDKFGFSDYEVLKDTIKNTVTGTEFIFKGLKHNIAEIKSTEGIDICWVEEAQSITKASLDILTPTIRKPGSQIIFTYNRVNELDPVHVDIALVKSATTFVKKVNFNVLEALGLLPDVIKIEIEKDKDNPATYAHKWLGEPLGQAEFSIVDRTEILDAMNREIEDDGQEIYGVDVARMGGDRTVFWKRKGLKTIKTAQHSKLRIPALCDLLEKFVDRNFDAEIKIDDTGVGGGVTDEMMRRGYHKIIAINFGGSAIDDDKYPNWISEAWFYMAEEIKNIQLPYDSDLLMELSTRQWTQDTKGKRRVESKKEYKKRGFRSPDIADACIICYAPHTKYITVDDIDM
jgi:phage terminase large subunit